MHKQSINPFSWASPLICFPCHVKIVTGVSPQAELLYRCLLLYRGVFVYCLRDKRGTSQTIWYSGYVSFMFSPCCQPCRYAWQNGFITGLTTCGVWTHSQHCTRAELAGPTEGQDGLQQTGEPIRHQYEPWNGFRWLTWGSVKWSLYNEPEYICILLDFICFIIHQAFVQ